ncbi:hypothetical protein WJX72_011916 [[Myrmecia] bisecta]|uniref:J domain-containing protein n=1 Tax=[Myrmecia] bisecta TaxID=41462 RepID=A0AAW1P5V8_9CHLO
MHSLEQGLPQQCSQAIEDIAYDILGVPRTADDKEIKKAFKRKALKLHPDVNKAPDAEERFMEAKHAYQSIASATKRAQYDRQQAGFDWGTFAGGSAKTAAQRAKKQADEAFYGIGDFIRDLDKDISERRRKRGKDRPGTLWEELADLGEEFVEFLEKELGVGEPETADARKEAARPSASQAASQGASSDAEARAAKVKQDAERQATNINDEVDDMLQEMKRKLGI